MMDEWITSVKFGNSPWLSFGKGDIKVLKRGDRKFAGMDNYLSPVEKSAPRSFVEADDVVPKERLNKGDIAVYYNDRGQLLEAQAMVRNILNHLWEAEKITGQQYHDAQEFAVWSEIYSATHGKVITLKLRQILSLSLKETQFGYLSYSYLIKRLNRKDVQDLQDCLQPFSQSYIELLVKRNEKPYKELFGRLSSVMPAIRERVAAIEQMDESQINQLAEDNLKKLLTDIRHAYNI